LKRLKQLQFFFQPEKINIMTKKLTFLVLLAVAMLILQTA